MSRDSDDDQHQQLTQAMLAAMKTMVVVALLLFGCKEKDKEAARDIAQSVKEKSIEAKDKVVEVGGELIDKAVEKGKAAKVELDKAYKSEHDYDLAVEEPDAAKAAEHAKKLEAMPSVEVNGVKVGYEEDSSLSLKGKTYTKHFRATWKREDGKIIRISYFTKETIDLAAFAQLLQKIVPAVMLVIK